MPQPRLQQTARAARAAMRAAARKTVTSLTALMVALPLLVVPLLATSLLVPAQANQAAQPGQAAQVAQAAQAAQAAAGQRYVALGDSYAAGLGVDPALTGGTPGCGQSARNYPHQLAQALNLTLVDVTCSGATTAALTGAQKVGSTFVAPQFDALNSDTALVTLTIGGNDLGFGSIASKCASLSGPDGPVNGGAQSCTSTYVADGVDTLAKKLTDVVAPAVAAVLTGIAAKAPQAKVVVVDYPALTPDAAHTPAAGCWANPLTTPNSLPLTTADLPYLQKVQAQLDQTLADAARKAGAGIAQTYPASLAHTACSSDPWVNGITIAGLAEAPGSLHPNLTGVTQMATAATAVARAVLAGKPAPSPVAVTTSAAGGGLSTAAWTAIAAALLVVLLITVGLLRLRRRRG